MTGQSTLSQSSNYSRKLDQFYTKPEIAKLCLAHLVATLQEDFQTYSIVLEPSAGTGSFYSLLDSRRIGLDVDPKISGIHIQDFFTWVPPSADKKILVVGNPPFGVQSALALKFFVNAAAFATTIAFIVPISWTKWSHQRRIPETFRLLSSLSLPKNSFLFEGKDYDVPCVFQIWTQGADILPTTDLRLREKPVTSHTDFVFLPRSQTTNADFLFVVCGARKQLIHEVTSSLSPFTVERIKCNSPKVRRAFEEINWAKYSNRTNTGTMWINRETIVREYEAWLKTCGSSSVG